MSEKFDGAGVPLGEAPPALTAQRERLKAVMESDGGKPKSKMTLVQKAPPSEPGGDDDKYVVDEPKAVEPKASPKWKSRPLKIEHDMFSLELEILEFSNSGKFITILFKNTFSLAEPENVCHFKLHFGGRTYNVEHMGINFDIPLLDVKGVSFIVVTKP